MLKVGSCGPKAGLLYSDWTPCCLGMSQHAHIGLLDWPSPAHQSQALHCLGPAPFTWIGSHVPRSGPVPLQASPVCPDWASFQLSPAHLMTLQSHVSSGALCRSRNLAAGEGVAIKAVPHFQPVRSPAIWMMCLWGSSLAHGPGTEHWTHRPGIKVSLVQECVSHYHCKLMLLNVLKIILKIK